MATQKACKHCKMIYEGNSKCPNCGSEDSVDTFKGKVVAIHPENSEIAQNLKITKKGSYAVKLG